MGYVVVTTEHTIICDKLFLQRTTSTYDEWTADKNLAIIYKTYKEADLARDKLKDSYVAWVEEV